MSSIISVSNLSKAYRIGKKADRADSFVGMLQDSLTAPFRNWRKMSQVGPGTKEPKDELHWALRDVSFDVQEGETLGVIGRNGAGKSTLLKVLSRITEPTNGEVRIKGRVASLLEVGTGFHPELTGRENVYLNGTILGMQKKEIDRKLEQIVEFSGIERFLDTAVKRYSSGMKVRLAFAVAAHLDPEVLIIDEVLAVGDASFQKRCMDRMSEIAREGKTILFVSHNLDLVDRLCHRAIFLQGGSLRYEGSVHSAIAQYVADGTNIGAIRDLGQHARVGDGRARFMQVEMLDASGRHIDFHRFGENLTVAFTIEANCNLKDVGVAVVLSSVSGNRIITSWNREADRIFNFAVGRRRICCDFENLRLRPGHGLWISLWMEQGGSVLDSVESAAEFQCRADDSESLRLSTDRAQGLIVVRQNWREDTILDSTNKGY